MESLTALIFSLLAVTSNISFDVPAIVPAQAVVRTDIEPQLPQSRLVDVTLDISTIVPANFNGRLTETVFEIRTQHEDVQIADFSPRTSMYSNVAGEVHVTHSFQQNRDSSVNASGFYPVFATADAHASFKDQHAAKVEMQQIAPMAVASAAGTLDRRTGVYFKMRNSPQQTLEGVKHFNITLEVPSNWRGDLLEVRTAAFGMSANSMNKRSEQQLARQHYYVAVYQQGDDAAAQTAMGFARQHIRLHTEADRFATEIDRRAMPTPMHKLGSVLDLYEPSIPHNWLDNWIFGSTYDKPIVELPVDLKVAMLDFQELRNRMLQLGENYSAQASRNQAFVHRAAYGRY